MKHVRLPAPLMAATLLFATAVGVAPVVSAAPAAAATPVIELGGWEEDEFVVDTGGPDLGDGGFTSPTYLRTNGRGVLTATWSGLAEHSAVSLGLHVAQLGSLDPVRDGDRLTMTLDGQPLLGVGLGFGLARGHQEPRVHDLTLFGEGANEALVDAVRTLTIDKSFDEHVYDFGGLDALQAIPHTGDTLTLTITGIGGQGWNNEAYAIDNLDLSLLDGAPWPTQRGVLAAGGSHTCGITEDATARCWGSNAQGQAAAPAGVAFARLVAGGHHTCGVTPDGTARCWGDNSFGQTDVPAGLTFTDLAAGEHHTCGITSDSLLRCWGHDGQGQIGINWRRPFTDVAAGAGHTCGIVAGGPVRCWGDGGAGQTSPPAGVTFATLAAGAASMCGISTEGSVHCWGDNTQGQTKAPSWQTFARLTAGSLHACGVVTHGAARCWGANGHGQSLVPSGMRFTDLAAGGGHTCGIIADGTVRCWGNDADGATDAPEGVRFGVDLFAPEIASALDGDANEAGWHNRAVTIGYSCADNFGVVDCPDAVRLDQDGVGQQVTGTATDPAGFVASVTDTVSLDLTAPSIAASLDRVANLHGWHDGPVTVTHDCGDALSGLVACSEPTTVDADGVTVVSGEATDLADNRADLDTTVRIDRVAPSIVASLDTPANPEGWHNGPVTVSHDCSDALSGVGACSEPTTVDVDGVTVVSGEGMDLADNRAGVLTTVRLDQVAPVIELSRDVAANAAGWINRPVEVTFDCDDDRSGVASCAGARTAGEGVTLVAGAAVDHADNRTEVTATVRVDLGAPTIDASLDTPPNQRGWHTRPVTVSHACADALSGVRVCSGPATVKVDGSRAVRGFAVDLADNMADVRSLVQLDTVAPSSSHTATTVISGLALALGSLSGTVADATSGVDGVAVTLTPAHGGEPVVAAAEVDCSVAPAGPGTVSCVWTLADAPSGVWELTTSATDVAGNVEDPVEHGTVVVL